MKNNKNEIFEGTITRDLIISMFPGQEIKVLNDKSDIIRTRTSEANIAAKMAGLPNRWSTYTRTKELGYVLLIRVR